MWVEEGEPEGAHERHWDAACREIDAQAAASTNAEVAPAPKKGRAPRAAATKGASPAEAAATAGEAAAASKAKSASAGKPAAKPAKRKSSSAKA